MNVVMNVEKGEYGEKRESQREKTAGPLSLSTVQTDASTYPVMGLPLPSAFAFSLRLGGRCLHLFATPFPLLSCSSGIYLARSASRIEESCEPGRRRSPQTGTDTVRYW